jgi:hypothetical protein
VRTADICVFVVIERFGAITWETELQAALEAGVPFRFLCLEGTYKKYLNLLRSVTSLAAIRDENDRSLVEALHEIESTQQLTILPFDHHQFKDALTRHLALLFSEGVLMLKQRSRRRALIPRLNAPGRLSPADLAHAVEIAQDEF